jgi:hypothetical protein
MRELAPGLTAIAVPGRSHVPTLDEPAARAAIDAFLDRLPPRSPIGGRVARRHAGWLFRQTMIAAGYRLADLGD